MAKKYAGFLEWGAIAAMCAIAVVCLIVLGQVALAAPTEGTFVSPACDVTSTGYDLPAIFNPGLTPDRGRDVSGPPVACTWEPYPRKEVQSSTSGRPGTAPMLGSSAPPDAPSDGPSLSDDIGT